MRFCVTNDDGYEALGLAVLARVAGKLGPIEVVAPASGQSQTGQAVTLNRALRIESRTQDGLGLVRVVDGTPTDCVRVSVAGVAGSRPEWVLSGINHGANLGVDVFYSGTVAAAREAAIHGVRGIAFSQFIRRPHEPDWAGAAVMVRRVLDRLLTEPTSEGTFWTVTFPAIDDGFETVEMVEAPLESAALPLCYEVEGTEGEKTGAVVSCRYAGNYMERVRKAGTDVEVAFGGRIAVTRLSVRGG